MFTQKSLAAAAAIALLPMGAYAGSFELTGSVYGTLLYDDNLDKIDDYIELEATGTYSLDSGVYFGLYGYYTSAAATDEFEGDLFIGYANDVNDKFGYDVYLTGYWFNDTGYSNYDITLDLNYAISDNVSATLEFSADPENDTYDHSLAFEIAVDKWTIIPTVGVTDGSVTYTELEFIYGLDNGLWFEVDINDDDTSSPTIGFLVGYDFTLIGG